MQGLSGGFQAYFRQSYISGLRQVPDLANKAQKAAQEDAERQFADMLPGELHSHPVLSICACARCRTLPTRLRRRRRSCSMLSCLRGAAT